MIRFFISPEIKSFCPDTAVGVMEYEAEVIKSDAALWEAIQRECGAVSGKYKIEELAGLPEIADSRGFTKNAVRIRPGAACRPRR